jgi:hypothetical protein
VTASVAYHHKWNQNNWQTTLAWGRNMAHPGSDLDGVLLESLVNFRQTHTIFGRVENVRKDELFAPGDPRDDEAFTVNKFSAGYIYDFPAWQHIHFGVGGLGSAYILPDELRDTYGDTPLSFMLFVRAKL